MSTNMNLLGTVMDVADSVGRIKRDHGRGVAVYVNVKLSASPLLGKSSETNVFPAQKLTIRP